MVVVFDMGGVMIDLHFEKAVGAFREIAGFDRIEEFLDSCHQRGIFLGIESGEYTADEFVGKAREFCKPGVTREDIQRCFDAFLGDIHPEKVRIVQQLAKSYDLYILSNNNPFAMRTCAEKFAACGLPIEKYFKKAFLSYEMKMMKPAEEIYNAAIAGIGLPPSEILFLDDSPRNVEGARAAGIDARLCRSVDDFFTIFAGLI